MAPERFAIPNCKVLLRAVPERRPWSRQKHGIVLIINEPHRDKVLAAIQTRSGE
jgi:hypothetical protein